MFIDSHCHLDFPDLVKDIDAILDKMRANDVTHALCVSVQLGDLPECAGTG